MGNEVETLPTLDELNAQSGGEKKLPTLDELNGVASAPTATQATPEQKRKYLEKDGKYFLDNGNGRLAPITKTTYDFGVKNVTKTAPDDIPLVTEDLKPIKKPISEYSKQKTKDSFKSNPIFNNPHTREIYYKSFEDKGFDTSELRKIGTAFDQVPLGEAPGIVEGQTIEGPSGQPINVETGQPIQTQESERMKNVVSAMELEASPFTAPIQSYQGSVESFKKSHKAFKEDKNVLGVLEGAKGFAEGIIGGLMTGANGLLFNAAVKAVEQGGADTEAIFAPLTKTAKQFGNYDEASDEYKALLSLGDLAVVGKALHMAGKPFSKLNDSPPTKAQIEKAKESITKNESTAILEHPDLPQAAEIRTKQLDLIEDQKRVAEKNPEAAAMFQEKINDYDNQIQEQKNLAEENNINEATAKSFDHHLLNEKKNLEELIAESKSEDGKAILQGALDEVNDIVAKRKPVAEEIPNTPKMDEVVEAPVQDIQPDIPVEEKPAVEPPEQVVEGQKDGQVADKESIYAKEMEDLFAEDKAEPDVKKNKKGEKSIYHHTELPISEIKNRDEGIWFTENKYGAVGAPKGNVLEKTINPSELNLATNKEFMDVVNKTPSWKERANILKEKGFDGVQRTVDGDKHYWIFDLEKLNKDKAEPAAAPLAETPKIENDGKIQEEGNAREQAKEDEILKPSSPIDQVDAGETPAPLVETKDKVGGGVPDKTITVYRGLRSGVDEEGGYKAGKFVTTERGNAERYDKNVAEFTIPNDLKTLKYDSKEADDLAREFLEGLGESKGGIEKGDKIDFDDKMSLFTGESEEVWVDFLKGKGYDATSIENSSWGNRNKPATEIHIFDPKAIKPIDPVEGAVEPAPPLVEKTSNLAADESAGQKSIDTEGGKKPSGAKNKIRRRGTPKRRRVIRDERYKAALKIDHANNPHDAALQHFIAGGEINKSAIQELFGDKNDKSVESERKARFGIMGKDAPGIQELAHSLWENRPEGDERFDTQDYRNAIEEVLTSHTGRKSMVDDILNRHNDKAKDLEDHYANEYGDLAEEAQQAESILDHLSEEELQKLYEDESAIDEIIDRENESPKDFVTRKGEAVKDWAKKVGITPKGMDGVDKMGVSFDDVVDLAVKLIHKGIDLHSKTMDMGAATKKAIEEALEKITPKNFYKDIVGDRAAEFEKQVRETFAPKEAAAESTSTKNAVVNAERLKQGLPPIEKVKVDTESILQQVKKHLDDPETYQSTDKNVNPHVLAKWSSENPSEPISAWQEMLLASERDKLNTSLEAAEKAKQQAIDNGDAKGVLEANALIENKIELLRMNDKANSYRGTQWSGIGRIRQKMIQEDYSHKGLLRKYNVVNHFEPIPKEVQADLEARGNKITELEKRLAEEQKKVGTVVRDKKIKEAATRLSDAIRKGKLSRPGVFSAATPASLVWDAALEVVAKTIDATGSVAQAVADGLNHIKDSEWYKGATDDIKKEAEESFEDWFSDRKAREEKKVDRLQKKLDDLLAGKTEESKKRTEDSPEAKALKEEIKKAKEALGLVGSKPLPEVPVGAETRLQKALENWKEKNATGDYETEPRIEREDTPIERQLKLQIAEERRKADRVIESRRLKDRPWYKKLADFLSEYQHLAVITSPKAIGKIAANVPMRLALHTVYDAARGTILNLPGLRMAENAPAEFRANMKSIAKRWSTIVAKDTWQDTWSTIIGKTTKADILKAKDLEDRNPNWGKGLNILRQLLYSTGVGIHKALKDPVFRAEYEASLTRYNEALINNHDITDPDVVSTANGMAVADGLAAQFMQDNNFVSRWRQAVGDATDKQTYPGKEAVKFGAKILNPVVKLPANYAREILNLQTGLFQAMFKGAEMIADKTKRTPIEKNKLTKKILMGGAGALAISYGWNSYKNFGGYYTSSKDLENELPLGAVKIGNEVFGETVVGKVFIHFPLIAVMQIAATARRKYEDYKAKGDDHALSKGLGYGAAATFEDLPAMENLSTTGEKILHGNVEGVAKNVAKSFVPNVVNYFTKPSQEEQAAEKEQAKVKESLQNRMDKKHISPQQRIEKNTESRKAKINRLLHEQEMKDFAKKNGVKYLPPR